jgi:hypothetical protein
MADAGVRQTACDVTGALVHVGPRVPDRIVWLAGDHAFEAAPGVEVHRLGKLAHGNPFGFGALAPRISCALVEPLRRDRSPPLPGPTVTVEEPLVFTSDDPALRLERGAERFGRPDCTDPSVADNASTPPSVQVVTFSCFPAGTKPHPYMHNRKYRLTSEFAPARRGPRSPP